MTIAKVLILISLIGFSETIFAQQAEEQTNLSTIKIDGQKTGSSTNDIDSKITAAHLRAELGSKSKWSFKSKFNYTGGSLNSPLSKVAPNIRASRQMKSISALSGDVGVNYRISAGGSIEAGTGVLMVAPLHGDPGKPVDDDRNSRASTQSRYQVSSPYLEWRNGYRVGSTMMLTSLKYNQATDHDSKELLKTFGKIMALQHMNRNIDETRWSIGAATVFQKLIYSGEVTDPALQFAMKTGILQRPDHAIGIIPYIQYSLSERTSLRTDFAYFNFIRFEKSSNYIQDEPFQSFGLGITITRDVYLYPNVQFAAKDIRSDRSSVSLSANINLF